MRQKMKDVDWKISVGKALKFGIIALVCQDGINLITNATYPFLDMTVRSAIIGLVAGIVNWCKTKYSD